MPGPVSGRYWQHQRAFKDEWWRKREHQVIRAATIGERKPEMCRVLGRECYDSGEMDRMDCVPFGELGL